MLMDVESTLRVGDILVPLIFMSDRTHHSKCVGNQKELSEYTTIGNVSSKIRQMRSMHGVEMVCFLLCPIENHNNPQKGPDNQRQTN